jgi:hypothetical protein
MEGDMAAFSSFLEAQPYAAAFLTCGLKASAADLVVQTKKAAKHVAEHSLRSSLRSSSSTSVQAVADDDDVEQEFDMTRNLAFLFYGGLLQGMCQQFLFTSVYPSWFGIDHSLATVAPRVLFDTTIMGPCVFMPICYSVQSIFAKGGLTVEAVQTALEKYVSDATTRGLLQKYWSIWIPAQFLNFGVIPAQYQVFFVAAVSFFWVCALSSISSSTTTDENDRQQMRVPAVPFATLSQHPQHAWGQTK